MTPDSRGAGTVRADSGAARRRQDGLAIFRAALDAVEPATLVRQALALEDDQLRIGAHSLALAPGARLFVVGAGKATPAMAAAAEEVLGERLTAGAINTKYDHAVPLHRIETVECGHPLPDAAGVAGSKRILQLVDGLRAEDVVLCLFSGGGSALMPAPAEGLSL